MNCFPRMRRGKVKAGTGGCEQGRGRWCCRLGVGQADSARGRTLGYSAKNVTWRKPVWFLNPGRGGGGGRFEYLLSEEARKRDGRRFFIFQKCFIVGDREGHDFCWTATFLLLLGAGRGVKGEAHVVEKVCGLCLVHVAH